MMVSQCPVGGGGAPGGLKSEKISVDTRWMPKDCDGAFLLLCARY